MSGKRNATGLATKSTDELVGDYRTAALDHGDASDAGDSKRGNRAYDRLSRIRHELARRGPEHTRCLLGLLDDEALSVRVWAASEALSFAPAQGLRVLRQAADGPPGLVRLSAEMVLKRWDAGEWTPIP